MDSKRHFTLNTLLYFGRVKNSKEQPYIIIRIKENKAIRQKLYGVSSV